MGGVIDVEPSPRRGEIWDADLDPAVGHEQGKVRPVLIVSHDRFNAARNRLCIVVALTRANRGLPNHVPVPPSEGGLSAPSVIQCEQIRIISYDRLQRRRGAVSRSTLRAVASRLQLLLDLSA
ncbi:MAG: type II toxin-antitoxin system PemK/MazF family toxin [Thermomicrobiales bacterium]